MDLGLDQANPFLVNVAHAAIPSPGLGGVNISAPVVSPEQVPMTRRPLIRRCSPSIRMQKEYWDLRIAGKLPTPWGNGELTDTNNNELADKPPTSGNDELANEVSQFYFVHWKPTKSDG